MLRLHLSAALLAALLIACGGSDDDTDSSTPRPTEADPGQPPTAITQPTGDDPQPGSSPTTTETPPTVQQADPVGSVLSVGDATVNGSTPFSGTELFPLDEIRAGTGSEGDIAFDLGEGVIECDVRDGGTLRLRPTEELEFSWLNSAGVTGCSIDAEDSRTFAILGTDNVITVDSGTFGLHNGDLYVNYGIALIYSTSSQTSGEPIPVCPNQKVDLNETSPVPQPWEELPSILRPVLQTLPQRPFSYTLDPSQVAQSSFLKNLTSSEAPLTVYVETTDQPAQEAFIKSYFDLLLEKSDSTVSGVTVQKVDSATKATLLEEQTGAVLIERGQTITRNDQMVALDPDVLDRSRLYLAGTPVPVQTPKATQPTPVPDLDSKYDASGLFLDESGEPWRFVLEDDEVGNEAIRSFTRAAVLNGDISRVYRDAVGELPPCEYLQEIVKE